MKALRSLNIFKAHNKWEKENMKIVKAMKEPVMECQIALIHNVEYKAVFFINII